VLAAAGACWRRARCPVCLVVGPMEEGDEEGDEEGGEEGDGARHCSSLLLDGWDDSDDSEGSDDSDDSDDSEGSDGAGLRDDRDVPSPPSESGLLPDGWDGGG
jgi:hypothetical protein